MIGYNKVCDRAENERYDHEEYHSQAMGCNNLKIPNRVVLKEKTAGHGQLETNHGGQNSSGHSGYQTKNQVVDRNTFMIYRINVFF